MEPVQPRRPIVGRHDESKQLLASGDIARRRVRDGDVLLAARDRSTALLGVGLAHVGAVADALGGSAATAVLVGGQHFLQRGPQPDPQRVFGVRELVDEVARRAPRREGGVGAAEGGAAAVVLLVGGFDQRGRVDFVGS